MNKAVLNDVDSNFPKHNFMDKKGLFEGLVKFKGCFTFAGEVCGSEILFEYKQNQFAMCFPNFQYKANNRLEVSLKGTNIKMDWSSREIWIPKSPHGLDGKIITFDCSQIIIRSDTPTTKSQANTYRKDLHIWSQLFVQWYEVITYRDTDYNNVQLKNNNNVEGYIIPPNGPAESVKDRDLDMGVISIEIGNDGVTKNQLTKVVEHASADIAPPPSHLLLVSALKHFNKKNYRETILNCATVLELLLAKILDDYLYEKKYEKKMCKYIQRQHNSLGKYVETLKNLEVVNPGKKLDDIKSIISAPRNKAIHAGMEVTQIMAKQALDYTKELLYKYDPLDADASI
jgi:hypothetical protein